LKDDRITHSIDQMIESQLISQNTCVVQLPQPYANENIAYCKFWL
ncbi:hypothetical protein MXE30_04305, partial [Acinetobacter baumannii]|nr:hypothetical protein [Acinetobacter baumannii]